MSFTDVQRRRLSSKLSDKHVKTRQADGAKLSYIEGWHAIAEANRIFGYDAWDRVTASAQCVWSNVIQGRYCCVYTAKVRITVRAGEDCVVREGNGTGEAVSNSAGAAHDVALKAAETDATKRALATFGNPFGLALHDKELAGVRRSRKKCERNSDHGDWMLRGADGRQEQLCDGPKAFVCRLRKELAEACALENLEAVWTKNCGELDRLRKEVPDLTDESNRHYADVLVDFCEERARDLKVSDSSKSYKIAATNERQTNGSVDKSVLNMPEPRRLRDKEHLKFVESQSCLVCDRWPAQAHHLRFAQPKAMARKVSDEFTVPLCATHHQQLHQTGDEIEWWKGWKIDPLVEAERLWSANMGERKRVVSD